MEETFSSDPSEIYDSTILINEGKNESIEHTF